MPPQQPGQPDWDAIAERIKGQVKPRSTPPAPASTAPGGGEHPILTAGKTFAGDVIKGVSSIPSAVRHPMDTLKGLWDSHTQTWKKADDSWAASNTKEPWSSEWMADRIESVRQRALSAVPVLGPQIEHIGSNVKELKDIPEAIGHTAAMGVMASRGGNAAMMTGLRAVSPARAATNLGIRGATRVLNASDDIAALHPGGARGMAITALNEGGMPTIIGGRKPSQSTSVLRKLEDDAIVKLDPAATIRDNPNLRGQHTRRAFNETVNQGNVPTQVAAANSQMRPLSANPRTPPVGPNTYRSSDVFRGNVGAFRSVDGQSGAGPAVARGRSIDLLGKVKKANPQASSEVSRVAEYLPVREALGRPATPLAEISGLAGIQANIIAATVNRMVSPSSKALYHSGRAGTKAYQAIADAVNGPLVKRGQKPLTAAEVQRYLLVANMGRSQSEE